MRIRSMPIWLALLLSSPAALGTTDVGGHYYGRYVGEAVERCSGNDTSFCIGFFLGATYAIQVIGESTSAGTCPKPDADENAALERIYSMIRVFKHSVGLGAAEVKDLPVGKYLSTMFKINNRCTGDAQEAENLRKWRAQSADSGRDLVEVCAPGGSEELCLGTLAGIVEILKLERAVPGTMIAGLGLCLPEEINTGYLLALRRTVVDAGIVAGALALPPGRPRPDAAALAGPKLFIDGKSPGFVAQAALLVPPGCGVPAAPDARAVRWFNAVKADQLKEIQGMLMPQPDLAKVTDASGQTALYVARSQAVVDLLVSQGAQLEALDKEGMTPLMSAARRADRKKVDMLLATGASVATPGAKRTVLEYAEQSGNAEFAAYMREVSALGQYPVAAFFKAVTGNYPEETRRLLALTPAFANARARDWVHAGDRRPPLYIAMCVSEEMFQLLAAAGAELSLPRFTNRSLLHEAVACGNRAAIDKLLALGTYDVNDFDTESRYTVLIAAIMQGDVETTRKLIRAGVDLKWKDDDGQNAMDWAIAIGNAEIIEIMRQAGVVAVAH